MESIADTIHSLKMQTVLPEEIIVVDDCSRQTELAMLLASAGSL
jgi:glycosyltransferase involved in cell wall biosynthesis